MKEKKYYSEALMVVHQSAQDMFEIGAISDARMREYDKSCLVPEAETARKPEESPKRGHLNPAAAGV